MGDVSQFSDENFLCLFNNSSYLTPLTLSAAVVSFCMVMGISLDHRREAALHLRSQIAISVPFYTFLFLMLRQEYVEDTLSQQLN